MSALDQQCSNFICSPSIQELLQTNQLTGQRVLNGSEYCMVEITPRSTSLKSDSHHNQKQREYREASENLKQLMCEHITQSPNQGARGNSAENPTKGIQPSFKEVHHTRRTSTQSDIHSRFTSTSESSRSALRRQLHVELNQLTTPIAEDNSLPRLTLRHGNPKGFTFPLEHKSS